MLRPKSDTRRNPTRLVLANGWVDLDCGMFRSYDDMVFSPRGPEYFTSENFEKVG